MLINPFTPAAIASEPDEFFGRTEELATVENSLRQGSVVLDGPIGIGKSSLLSQEVLAMEGFGTNHRSKSVTTVGHRDIKTVDDAALLLLQEFVQIDERQRSAEFKMGLGIPDVVRAEYTRTSAEIFRYFTDGRHLSGLQKIVERECLRAILGDKELLLLCIDEADKCPIPIARLVRSLLTYTQQQGVRSVRFVLAGVSPFFGEVVTEDPGLRRFFYRHVTLKPLSEEDSTDLLETKLTMVARHAEKEGESVKIHPRVISRVVELSGGHPHILQLLGSHLVEHENEDPDGIIDSRDLANCLRRVCYEDRAQIYDATLHMLELEDKMDSLSEILEACTGGFPTRIEQDKAVETIGNEAVQWFVEHNVLVLRDGSKYGLVDEFLRIRLLLDQLDKDNDFRDFERDVLRQFAANSSFADTETDLEDDIRIIEEE
jgi:AAA+ ATPase superfamily predicted ATPase